MDYEKFTPIRHLRTLTSQVILTCFSYLSIHSRKNAISFECKTDGLCLHICIKFSIMVRCFGSILYENDSNPRRMDLLLSRHDTFWVLVLHYTAARRLLISFLELYITWSFFGILLAYNDVTVMCYLNFFPEKGVEGSS